MAQFSTEQRDYMVDAKLIPLGYQQITSLSLAKGLSPPLKSRVCIIQAITQNIRWRDDSIEPTNSVGMVLAAGADMLYTGNLAKIRFIEVAANAELNVSYYF